MKTCLVFLLEEAFLPGLRVLAYSLHATGSFKGVPKVIVTNDAKVRDDAFVRAYADHIVFLSEQLVSAYSELDSSKVPDRHKLEWIPKYTFLKFNIYRDFGYDRHIYLDVDMIALNNADGLLNADFASSIHMSPSIPHKDLYKRDTENQGSLFDENFSSFNEFADHHYKDARHYNSGVVVASRPIVDDGTFDKLLATAAKYTKALEQEILRVFLSNNKIAVGSLSPWFNVTRPTLALIGPDNFEKIRDKIVFHHFTGPKPWERGKVSAIWVEDLWREVEAPSRDWIESVLGESRSAPDVRVL